jgi:hypothetical protein
MNIAARGALLKKEGEKKRDASYDKKPLRGRI